MKNRLMEIVVWVFSIVCSIIVFMLPDTIPTHWNVYGDVDGYGSRYVAFVFVLLPILIYYGMTLDKYIDPRKRKKENKEVYDFFRNGLTLFFIFLGGYFLAAIFRPSLIKEVSIAGVFALLFIGMGNYLPRIPHNYTLGIKTPWTLESEYVWRKTHRLGGYVFVIGGLVLLVSSFIALEKAFIVLIISLVFVVIVPCVYSYLLYKKEEKKDDNNI